MKYKYLEEDESVYKTFLDSFGEDLQYTLTFEEMGELSQALCKYIRKHDNCTPEAKEELINHIAEEIADVKLCLEELQYMFNIGEKVKEIKDYKVARGKARAEEKNLQLEIKCKKQ